MSSTFVHVGVESSQLDHQQLEGSDPVAVPGAPGWHSSKATSTSRSDSYSLHHLLDTNPPPKYWWVMPTLLKGFFLRWGMWRVVVVVDFIIYHVQNLIALHQQDVCSLLFFLRGGTRNRASSFFSVCNFEPSTAPQFTPRLRMTKMWDMADQRRPSIVSQCSVGASLYPFYRLVFVLRYNSHYIIILLAIIDILSNSPF